MFRYVFTDLLLNVQISQCRKATGAAGVVFFLVVCLFVCLVGWLLVVTGFIEKTTAGFLADLHGAQDMSCERKEKRYLESED